MRVISLDTEGAWLSESTLEGKNSVTIKTLTRLSLATEADFATLPVLCQGFYDSHMHPTWMAKMHGQLNASGKSLATLVEQIMARSEEEVFGFGWDESSLGVDLETLKKTLDALPKKIVLYRICRHLAYVSGQGFLKENELRKLPQPALEVGRLLQVMQNLQQAGIDECADLLVSAQDYEKIFALPCLAFGDVKEFSQFAPFHPPYMKYFLDGSLGAHTAWLSEPYADAPSQGLSLWSDAALLGSMTQTLTAGYRLAFHAIGDAALDQLLRVAEALKPALEKARHTKFPHRIEHAQVCRDDQIEKIKAQGFWTLGLQPSHRVADAAFAAARLGVRRLEQQAYRLKSFIAAGVPASLGSDAPIVDYDPALNFRAIAMDARPHEKISLAQTYALYCVEGRQNVGITAKKLLPETKAWLSTLHL